MGVGEHVAMSSYLAGSVFMAGGVAMAYGWQLTLAGLAVLPLALVVAATVAKVYLLLTYQLFLLWEDICKYQFFFEVLRTIVLSTEPDPLLWRRSGGVRHGGPRRRTGSLRNTHRQSVRGRER